MKAGSKVRWAWGEGHATGVVRESFARRVQRTIKGRRIVRNGTEATPALLIEQADGDRVLKLASEVERA